MFITPFVFGVFGLIIGSFLNVLILRQGIRSVSGRSACMSCDRRIHWYDLIPVVSWIFLRGRCRNCGAAISIQYPLVEGGTGIVFAVIGAAPILLLSKLLSLPIAALLIAIAVHDLRTTIIPDAWVAITGVLSLISAIVGVSTTDSYVVVLLAGPLAALPLFILWYVSDGRWMGLGDPKLALTLGWLLGFPGGFSAVFLAFIIGAAVGIPLLALSSPNAMPIIKKLIPIKRFQSSPLGFTMKSEIPFGPFLIASCFIVWFSQMYSLVIPFVWQ